MGVRVCDVERDVGITINLREPALLGRNNPVKRRLNAREQPLDRMSFVGGDPVRHQRPHD
jgi:hypothetical protein